MSTTDQRGPLAWRTTTSAAAAGSPLGRAWVTAHAPTHESWTGSAKTNDDAIKASSTALVEHAGVESRARVELDAVVDVASPPDRVPAVVPDPGVVPGAGGDVTVRVVLVAASTVVGDDGSCRQLGSAHVAPSASRATGAARR